MSRLILVRPFGRHLISYQSSPRRLCAVPSSYQTRPKHLGGSAPSVFRDFKSSPFFRTMNGTMEDMQHLEECVDTEGLDKWGWVFYRCTYSDDDAWSRFKEMITQSFQEEIEDSGSPELAARLRERFDLTFFEDKNLFNGVTKDQLRAHFRQWAAETFPLENPRGILSLPGDSPWQRYRYFIQMDDDALRSNFEGPRAYGYPRECYVNFVDGYWKSLHQVNLENSTPRNYRDIDPEHEKAFEPIEGCVEENVGWMKLSTFDVSTEFYVNIGGGNTESWRTFYKRPPAITKW